MKFSNINSKTNQYEKNKIDRKLESLKHLNADPNNIILNSAAIQDQMLIEMGIKRKKMKKLNYVKSINLKTEDKYNKPIPKILDKILKKQLDQEKQVEIIQIQKTYLTNLTLAQKIGLKEITKMPLSLEEWKSLENLTIKRNDHKSNCPICLESFHLKDTMILSCSHVFHKICIKNFEKFSNNKKCPICRQSNYESKIYYKDKEYIIKYNIILIQKNYLGYSLRLKLYKNIFKHEMPNNKHLRSIYSHWKIKELTVNMCKIMEEKIKESHNEITDLVKQVKQISIENTQSIKEIIKTNRIDLTLDESSFDWNKIYREMQKRSNDNCAICFGSLNRKNNYLLNCTHCFHKNCLDSFERFDCYYERRCPICRKNYEKKEVFMNF
jgi:hypothetical protein